MAGEQSGAAVCNGAMELSPEFFLGTLREVLGAHSRVTGPLKQTIFSGLQNLVCRSCQGLQGAKRKNSDSVLISLGAIAKYCTVDLMDQTTQTYFSQC